VSARGVAALGAIQAFLAVGFGAFGAHGLRSRMLGTWRIEVFETGARYHMVHALGLFAIAWLIDRGTRGARAAALVMNAGILLFCGSLYLLGLTGERSLGAITPFGGGCFLLAWGILIWGILSGKMKG
jgi:uncharacterized membrane protein YgdD (TMEM256/DUF423 family)